MGGERSAVSSEGHTTYDSPVSARSSALSRSASTMASLRATWGRHAAAHTGQNSQHRARSEEERQR